MLVALEDDDLFHMLAHQPGSMGQHRQPSGTQKQHAIFAIITKRPHH